MTGFPDREERAAFFATAQGKIISALIIIAVVLGIAAEGVTIYRNVMESKTAAETAHNATAQKEAEANERVELAKKAAADAETARAAADNAGKLKLAEANERAELAKKAAADAETARATADNAGKLRLAEAEERTQLAKKAAADAETARATADNSARLQAGLAAKAQEEAETQRQKNKILRAFTDGGGSADEMVQRDFNRQMNILGMGNDPAPQQRRSEAAVNAPQVPPKCRQPFGNWQGYTSHAAFALTDDGECVWNGNGSVYQSSTAQAVASLKDYCNKKNWVCTIIATK